MKLLSFGEALEKASQSGSKNHILLGNGFGIAFKQDIFSYKALFKEADFSKASPEIKLVFEAFNTQDFEFVIQKLKDTALVLRTYRRKDVKFIKQLEKDAELLKEILVSVLCKKHPKNPSEIKDYQYDACSTFLSNFDHIFTLNYDLLLYWVIINDLYGNKKIKNVKDGFRYSELNEDYVTWHPEDAKEQSIYFLHGALHLFDSGPEINKFTWIKTGISLMEQIRESLQKDWYPLFVSEGTSEEKMTKINHSQYLGKGIRSFASITGNLFIYGHSLAENDMHYLNLIAKSRIQNLFISIYGDINDNKNKDIVKRAEAIKNKRLSSNKSKQQSLAIDYFDAITANIWGNKK